MSDGSRSTIEKPTVGLRWKDGVLQQIWEIVEYSGITILKTYSEWRDVPADIKPSEKP